MMIIQGVKKVHLNTQQCSMSFCPNCNKQGFIHMSLFRRHFHLFWIPMFPLKKRGFSHCSNCDTTLREKDMPEQIKRSFLQFKKDTKAPLWQFAGLGLVTIILFWGSSVINRNQNKELSYLNNPKTGDVYHYRIAENAYSTFKIEAVSKDSIFINPNLLQTGKFLKSLSTDRPENHVSSVDGISKLELNTMYENGEILSIHR